MSAVFLFEMKPQFVQKLTPSWKRLCCRIRDFQMVALPSQRAPSSHLENKNTSTCRCLYDPYQAAGAGVTWGGGERSKSKLTPMGAITSRPLGSGGGHRYLRCCREISVTASRVDYLILSVPLYLALLTFDVRPVEVFLGAFKSP